MGYRVKININLGYFIQTRRRNDQPTSLHWIGGKIFDYIIKKTFMSHMKKKRKHKPSWFWLATEVGRATVELGMSVPYRKCYRANIEGDGHPVLVLPGFMASDYSTSPLREFINKIGYTSYAWDLGRNYAKVSFIEDLSKRLVKLHIKHNQAVTIIGWSLGGVYARQLAKLNPNIVRQVITMGSPFRGITKFNNASWMYNLLPGNKRVVDLDPALLNDLPLPAPVPTTAIYSKEDGIVPWRKCMEKVEDNLHQNIQVRGSHLGLGINISVFEIIADRLQYESYFWTPFVPASFFKDLIYYPSL